ncbi:MAG: oligosaccharide flippase family protein [Planctomycetota bacterium]|nr:oligosaccharide flippase family protein [Planctomycetota bacterium]
MPLRKNILRGSASLGLGQLLSQSLTLVRSAIIAHLITRSDVGLGSLFIATITLFEMISNVRPDAMIIQARDGDDARLQSSAQSLEVLRGASMALVMFLCAGPIANAFGSPETTWAFRWLALVPLLAGLHHLDPKRLQRNLEYGPEVRVTVGSHLVATAAAWPLASWLGDYSAMLYVVLLRATTQCLLTHLYSSRAYRWGFDPRALKRILSFGWPLLANGLLMFGILQGDRMIIGWKQTHFTLADLGLYSMAWNLTAVAGVLVGRVVNPILLPLFARTTEGGTTLDANFGLSCQMLAIFGTASAIFFTLLGGPLMSVIYGSEYGQAGAFIAWLAAMQAVRILRQAPIQASISLADTRNPLLANLARSLSLVAATIAALSGAQLVVIACCGWAGESLALIVSTLRLKRVCAVRASACFLPALWSGLWLAGAILGGPLLTGLSLPLLLLTCALSLVGFLGASTLVFPALRREGRRLAQSLLSRAPSPLANKRPPA